MTIPTEADLQAAVRHVSDPENSTLLANLRFLAKCDHPAQVAYDTRWLTEHGLVAQSNKYYEFRARFVITDAGRAALHMIDHARKPA